MLNKNLVIFDFCGTLVKFQTADRYVNYCIHHLENKDYKVRSLIVKILENCNVFSLITHLIGPNNYHKRLVLWQLKGVREEQCKALAKKYFEEELLPNCIETMVLKMKNHQEMGDEVWILSGGYDIYIKYYVEYFGLAGFISSSIEFIDGKCTGKMLKEDCMGETKVKNMRLLPTVGKHIIVYTDDKSDIPLLRQADKGVVVSHRHSQDWVNKIFEEIIWI